MEDIKRRFDEAYKTTIDADARLSRLQVAEQRRQIYAKYDSADESDAAFYAAQKDIEAARVTASAARAEFFAVGEEYTKRLVAADPSLADYL